MIEEPKQSFLAKYKMSMLFLLSMVIAAIVFFNLPERKEHNKSIEEFALNDLKKQFDDISTYQKDLKLTINSINSKLDKNAKELSKTRSNITNIYKTEINEKSKLNLSNDSVNLSYFNAYVESWISSNSPEESK